MSGPWKYITIDFYSDVAEADQPEALDWLRSLGVDPKTCAPGFVITHLGDEPRYQLHLTRYVLDADGNKFIDFAADRPHTEPLVVDLGPEAPTFPWLLDAFATQERRKNASVVLQRHEARVVVMEAPRSITATLELLQQSEPRLLGVQGDKLHLGKDEQGREVVYRVVGWQADPPALKLRRIQPEDEPQDRSTANSRAETSEDRPEPP